MAKDVHLEEACRQVEDQLGMTTGRPIVRSFFDEATFTASHVIHDPAGKSAAIIDPVLDFDPAAARISTRCADSIIAYVQSEGLKVQWLLETHVHADHLSAAAYLQSQLGGRTGIGSGIVTVQQGFGALLNQSEDFARDGSQFDRLFDDGDRFTVGAVPAVALDAPGHTPADVAYVIGDCVFVGDTMFMPDYGSARVDFPGGDARQLYRSIRRLMGLPGRTRVFLCHDYKAPGRDQYAWETTMTAQCRDNVHVNEAVEEGHFATMREERDKALPVPRLLLPAIQVNMRAGRLPEPEANETRYLKIPLNRF
jgi:glyoxylase-like metal-dependent hydrolase (beta-lactamase superfamily II)